MSPLHNRFVTVLLVLVVVMTALLALNARPAPAAAQDSPATLRTLIERLHTNGVGMSFQFAVPLVSGQMTWGVPDNTGTRRLETIGEDFICFSEPTNEGQRRNRCTPYSNIVAVMFAGG